MIVLDRLVMLDSFKGIVLLISFAIVSGALYDGRVRIRTDDGHLIFMVPDERNISLVTGRNGKILFNGEDMGNAYWTIRNVSTELATLRQRELASLQLQQTELMNRLSSDATLNLNERITSLESVLSNITSQTGQSSDDGTPAVVSGSSFRGLRRRVRTLERSLDRLTAALQRDECASMPCRNGGTCIDSYNSFKCLCSSNWEGPTCEIDVDECANFRGSDLGCQNGATCINTVGSFRCSCPPGWFGVHCTQRTDGCNSGTNEQICGHGICISQPGQGRGYMCLCEQGWTTDGVNPGCTVDINECNYPIPLCSVNPRVDCINLPGSFRCGPCPQGYTGNGHYCADIDECQINNGGCSLSPRVQCTNTIGSRSCGPCPPGYQGDGVHCSFVGACSVNNGGCHPSAFCYDNPAISASYVSCQCRPGFTGNGFGPMGCVPAGSGPSGGGSGTGGGVIPYGDPCSPNPCVFGTCTTVGNGFQCNCQPGYAGQLCNIPLDPCMSAPCRNGGTCAIVGPSRQAHCICPSGFTGDRCQNEIQACGGVLNDLNGTLTFPENDGGLYPHQINCAWVLNTTPGKVFNITFTRFHLETSPNCNYDWLQINDGADASGQLIGRFCGDQTIPGGAMITTHNQLYLWFRSDHSIAGQGFQLQWNTTDPVCGGVIIAEQHGSINSPGYPGRYPVNRHCIWFVSAPPGKRVQFTFATLQLEHHDNCSYDYLEIRDGMNPNDPLLGKFCSSANPPPLTTSGTNALVTFHSDATLSDYGFHITYALVNGVPGCGGLLTGPGGSLSSPNHPDTYEHNLDCEWVIRATPDEKIRLTFTALSLEAGRNCRFDYIEVREGGTAQGPLVGRYCGRNIPLPILSTGNQLYVRFRSDHSVASSGFRARFETVCGGTWTEPTGIIQSPNFPSPYPGNKQCTYTIALSPGKAIRLNFVSFDIEGSSNCRFDALEIRDGDSSNSTLIGKFCGPPSNVPPTIISAHNYLWMKFTTDASIHNMGFLANYTSVDVGCGGILTQPQGIITSPLHPETYPHGATCRWVIRAGSGKVVRLQWLSFALEPHPPSCRFDSVSVFDNGTFPSSGNLIGRYCGTALPPMVTTTGDTMTVVFQSDSAVAAAGFTASYVTLNSSSFCGGTYFTETGLISSPRYPSRYPPSLDCSWIIRAPFNRQVLLNITDFDFENDTQCQMDFLEIRNGGDENAPLIGRFCGQNIPRRIPSHGHEMYIRMKSDYSLAGRGFQIFWDATATGCGGTLTSPEGMIMSPGYPTSYGTNAECVWRIGVSQGSRVLFAFADLDMETQTRGCSFDYVEIRDGRDRRGKLIGRYCNSFSLVPIISKSNSLYIKFRSDSNLSGRGFKARYETLCNTEVRGLSGVIESPNFPNVYPHNRNCTWTISAPLGNTINITFSHFDVEEHSVSPDTSVAPGTCVFDYVEIRQPNGTLKRFCGSNIPEEVASTQDKVFVQFSSDISVAHNGFRLEWRVIGCGGKMAKPSGYFASPGYPSIYPESKDCVWEIETEPGSRVELTVFDFDIESASGCAYDFLQVRGGPDDTSPILTTLCHRQDKPVVLTSAGNRMYVHFHSDVSVRGKGFHATYTTQPQGCGGRFKSPVGAIHSPNYPQNYDHDADCGWLIEVPINHVVVLTFIDFDVEPITNCTFDYVAIYDGPSLDDPEIARFCGSSVPNPPVVVSSSNQMFVRLKADGSVAARGFMANYTTGCGARINVGEESGELTSPNFPHSFGGGLNCTWILTAPNPSDRVYLMFTHMDVHNERPDSTAVTADVVNCTNSFVRVQDGEDADAPVIGTYCLTRIPPAITSQGSSLFVHMLSVASVGVGFRATYSMFTQACGGEFTSEHGSFSSPLYPNSYPLSTECIWTISASPGNRVMVSFRMFNLQETEFCNGDYVEVRVNNAGGELLGHFCGSSALPGNITAANKLWIKFRSDADTTAPGFIADYSLLHGNELTGNRGEVTSPLFPFPYIHGGEFTWRITVDPERYVRLFFFWQFSIERNPATGECISALLIYDGYDDQAPLLGQYCGEVRPRRFVFATGNVLFIRFRSFFISEGSYFRLRWDGVTTPNAPSQVPEIPRSGISCGGNLFVSDGNVTTITSPGFPNGYDNNLACTWTLTADPHYRVAMTLVTLDMEAGYCQFDRVEIADGADPTATIMGRYCRRDQQGTVVTSNGNTARITFRTDSSVNKTGFQIDARAECGGIIRDSRGLIKSPKYPSSYPASTTCEWSVNVRPGRTISVRFDSMQISSDPPSCSQDYVILRNGDSVDSPVLAGGRLCGNSIPTGTIATTGNVLHVKFVSDAQTSGNGFQLRFQEVGTACGGRLTLSEEMNEAIIETPNRPASTPANAECEWIVLAPGGHAVQFDFVGQLDVPGQYGCRSAAVELRDGGTLSSPLLGKYCGANTPGSVFSRGNSMHIRYFNTVQNPGTGFQARVSIARCGGTIVASRGVILSPSYPSSYEPNTRCVWTIRGPVGHYLNLRFTNLDLPAASNFGGNCSAVDYVQIHDRNATNEILATVCGNAIQDVVSSYSNEVDVVFQTGSRVYNRQGFRLTFNASVEGCGGTLEGPSGIIQSPGYPNAYPHGRICVWMIRGPPGRRVTLTFTDFALEEPRRRTNLQPECSDFIYAANGPLQSSPLYANSSYRCGSTLPEVISSSGNSMVLIFRTDGSVTHRGFSARYDTDQPAVCGGQLNGSPGSSGYFTSPGLVSATVGNYSDSLYCEWQLINTDSSNSSVIFNIDTMDIEGPVESTGQCAFDSLDFYGGSSDIPLGRYCGNRTSGSSILNPFAESLILFRTDASITGVGFNTSYRVSSCGGVITSPQALATPNFPSYYGVNVDCVWLIDLSENGQQVQVTFEEFQLDSSDCTQDYLKILNGHLPSSPELGRYCGTNRPGVIRSQSSYLWIQFHSDGVSGSSRGVSFTVDAVTSGCGGIMHGLTGSLTSPNFPSAYAADTECEWEIRVEPGYTVIANFVQRFDVENSTNCANDFVELFEWRNETWRTLGRFCGKQFPPTVASTSETMKVLFRSNSGHQGDGFRMRWKVGCGGEFTSQSGQVASPNYPRNYGDNLVCNYTITAPADSYIVVNFIEPFDIENHPLCVYDRLSAYQGSSANNFPLGRYCGRRVPAPLISRSPLFLQFRTDGSIGRPGFKFNYTTLICGGTVTSPTTISSPAHPDTYHNNLNCTWIIEAPSDQVIDIKFQSLTLEAHRDCRYDWVAVFDGAQLNQSQLLGRFCGNFTYRLPRIKSRSSKAIVQFRTDWSESQGGFSASVRFTPGERQGCGGLVNLTRTAQQQLRAPDAAVTPRNGRFDGELDCQWTVTAPPGQVIRLQLTQVDMQDGGCREDYLEARDGPGESSSLIGRFCGSTVPPSLIGSSNVMWLRLVTGTSNRRANFVATLSYQETPCGSAGTVEASDATQTLSSPNYPAASGTNLRCRWLVDGNGTAVQLRFQHLSIGSADPAQQCSNDRLEIQDVITTGSGIEATNDLVLNGDGANIVHLDQRRVVYQRELGQRLAFCGNKIPHDVISSGGSLAVTLITGPSPPASTQGFQLAYSLATCNRTYDAPEGRIVSPRWPGVFRADDYCQFTIESPANTTISLYFNLFRLLNSINCSASSLEIRDGGSSSAPLLGNLCGSALPESIFSSGNRLWFRFRPSRLPLRGYDMTYTSSDQGRGCGGSVFNTRGSLTSPGYPGNVSRTTDCQWEVSVPLGMLIQIDFPVFQFGPTDECSNNYLEISDIQAAGASGEAWRARYCGNDRPASYLGSTNGATLRYVTAANNTGPGWRAVFQAVASLPSGN